MNVTSAIRQQAYELALSIHSNDKYGNEPYINHVMRVAAGSVSAHHQYRSLREKSLLRVGVNDDILFAIGALHDSIEDHPECEDSIVVNFHPLVYSIVVSYLTREKEKETYADYIRRILSNTYALYVKYADLSDHLSHNPTVRMRSRYMRAIEKIADEIQVPNQDRWWRNQ